MEAFLKLSKPTIEQTSRGTGLQHINQTTFWPLSFPLPPLNEQKRIVARLDQIMPRIEAVKKRLDKVPAIITRFRHSVLTAAVTGKLTEKWRAEHPDVESADVLLSNIIEERKQAKKSSNQQYSFKITGEIDERFISLEVPNSWRKTNVDSVSIFIADCPHSTPKWTASGKLCLIFYQTNLIYLKFDSFQMKHLKVAFQD
ncbi:MAG: restriction endonuclease subunit S [Bacillota bacterium]|nr:restriction endonuclease subunit S [Bacillota bacterium]